MAGTRCVIEFVDESVNTTKKEIETAKKFNKEILAGKKVTSEQLEKRKKRTFKE